jgi:hypothetical protein
VSAFTQPFAARSAGTDVRATAHAPQHSGLDANGLASLLRSQKDQMTAAIPSGLADQLGSAGLIDRAEAGVRSGMSSATAAGNRMANASGQAAAGASRAALAATNTQWPYWLAALVVLGGLASGEPRREGDTRRNLQCAGHLTSVGAEIVDVPCAR